MPVASAEILIKFSTKVGTAGNQNAGTAAGSLGKYISTTQIADASINNLFDNISGNENAASAVDYRCIFVHNSNPTVTLQQTTCFITNQVAGGASIAIGIDPTAASAIGSAGAQALEVANETTAPAGVAFSTPTTVETGIAIDDLAPGQCRAIWIRRTAANNAGIANDGATLRFQGNSL